MRQQRVDQRAVLVARRRMHDQAGRLVQHQQVRVLEQDRERHRLRLRAGGDRRGRLQRVGQPGCTAPPGRSRQPGRRACPASIRPLTRVRDRVPIRCARNRSSRARHRPAGRRWTRPSGGSLMRTDIRRLRLPTGAKADAGNVGAGDRHGCADRGRGGDLGVTIVRRLSLHRRGATRSLDEPAGTASQAVTRPATAWPCCCRAAARTGSCCWTREPARSPAASALRDEKGGSAAEDLRRLRPPVHLAPQMGARLGRGPLLLRRLPHRPPRHAPKRETDLRSRRVRPKSPPGHVLFV